MNKKKIEKASIDCLMNEDGEASTTASTPKPASIDCLMNEDGEVSIEISGTDISVAIIMIEILKILQHDSVPVVDIAMIARLAEKDEDYYSKI